MKYQFFFFFLVFRFVLDIIYYAYITFQSNVILTRYNCQKLSMPTKRRKSQQINKLLISYQFVSFYTQTCNDINLARTNDLMLIASFK